MPSWFDLDGQSPRLAIRKADNVASTEPREDGGESTPQPRDPGTKVDAWETTSEVRAAREDDLTTVTRIHKLHFSNADYTVGQYSVALIREFYHCFLGRSVFLVHASDSRVDGFVLGGERKDLHAIERLFLRNHFLACCLETLGHPLRWRAAFRTASRLLLRCWTKPASYDPLPVPRLLTLAVDESVKGSGVAKALVDAFESRLRRSYAAYELSVVKTNHRAVRFYQKLGLRVVAGTDPMYHKFRRDYDGHTPT
jgi:ribosomal protein S18 acetylase RimI-like enzyme